jgi:hypothetical protein
LQSELNDINQKALMLVLQKPKSTKDAEALIVQMAKLKSKIEKYRKGQPENTEDRYSAYVEDENKNKIILK